jgi:hypothetical protein
MKSIVLSIFSVTLISLSASTAMAQTGDEIIKKHIDAIGGEKNWEKVNTIKKTGSMTIQGMEIMTTATIVQNKGMRLDMSVMGLENYVILTTTEGWVYLPIQPGMDKLTPMPADEVKNQQDKLNIRHSVLADKSQIVKAEFLGRDTLDKVPCLKVAVTDKNGYTQTAFFDANTYYFVRSEGKLKVQDEEHDLTMTFSNFQRQPDGIVIAMTENNPQTGGADIVYKSIEINKPVADGTFKPTETKQ